MYSLKDHIVPVPKLGNKAPCNLTTKHIKLDSLLQETDFKKDKLYPSLQSWKKVFQQEEWIVIGTEAAAVTTKIFQSV